MAKEDIKMGINRHLKCFKIRTVLLDIVYFGPLRIAANLVVFKTHLLGRGFHLQRIIHIS